MASLGAREMGLHLFFQYFKGVVCVTQMHIYFYMCVCLCVFICQGHRWATASIIFKTPRKMNSIFKIPRKSTPFGDILLPWTIPHGWWTDEWPHGPTCGADAFSYSHSFSHGQQFLLLNRGSLQPPSKLSPPSVAVVYLGNRASVQRHCNDFNIKVPLLHLAASLTLFYKHIFSRPMLSVLDSFI